MAGGKRIDKNTGDFIVNLAKLPGVFSHEFLVYFEMESSPLFIANHVDQYKTPTTNGYLLISTINQSNHLAEIQLLDLSQKRILKSWQPDFGQLNLKEVSKFNMLLFHPLMYQGDVISLGNREIIRLNNKSNVVWKNLGHFHHSIELDSENKLWVCGTLHNKTNKNFIQSSIWDDGIFRIDPSNGKTIFSKSIYEIYSENGYQNLLLNTGPISEDLLHLNDIQPALKTTKYWKKGDLLISLRNRSTIFLYRPSTNKIIWLKTGPWNFQHDCDFLSDTEIGVFGNDVAVVNGQTFLINGYNNQYIYDFEKDQISIPYTQMFRKGKINTLTQGRSRILPDGQLFVEETNNGRILFGDKNGVNGIYVNRLDKEHISLLGWSRYYTTEEFNQLNN